MLGPKAALKEILFGGGDFCNVFVDTPLVHDSQPLKKMKLGQQVALDIFNYGALTNKSKPLKKVPFGTVIASAAGACVEDVPTSVSCGSVILFKVWSGGMWMWVGTDPNTLDEWIITIGGNGPLGCAAWTLTIEEYQTHNLLYWGWKWTECDPRGLYFGTVISDPTDTREIVD